MKVGKTGTKTLKKTVMKKIFAFLLLSITMVSCYEDYIFDNTYSGIYFPYQIDVRTFVVGEGMKVEVGAALGGVRDNVINRNVNYIFDNALLTPALAKMKKAAQPYIAETTSSVAALLPIPSNYYTISNSSTIVIKEGDHLGTVIIKPDSALFLADAATSVATYALPFYITDADADSVIVPKRSAVVAFRYENMLFGKYWHGGQAVVTDPGGTVIQTINYFTAIPQTESKVWVLKTTAPNALYTNGYLDQITGKNEMKLTLDGDNITVSSVIGSTYTILPDGASSFNRPKLLQDRKLFLKYNYVIGGNTYHCTDTLTFRNRIRDGVNEWQDENPSHYLK